MNTLSKVNYTDLIDIVKRTKNPFSRETYISKIKKEYGKERISSLERAKEIIMNDYSSKLSIKNIAYKSAINECYLKKDFKEYYGMTILEMLLKNRICQCVTGT